VVRPGSQVQFQPEVRFVYKGSGSEVSAGFEVQYRFQVRSGSEVVGAKGIPHRRRRADLQPRVFERSVALLLELALHPRRQLDQLGSRLRRLLQAGWGGGFWGKAAILVCGAPLTTRLG
jgi:hypothetical protein